MTTLNTNEFNNTVNEIRRLCKNSEQFATATYGLGTSHSRALAEKYGYDETLVSWGFDEMTMVFKHYTNIDTMEYEVLERI